MDLITGGFTGRMGNQMFQIAAVIALAKKHDVPFTFQRATNNDPHKIYFNHFPELPIENRIYHNENPVQYEEINYDSGTLCLCGFYQSYKYFEDYRKEIIDAFGLKYCMLSGHVSIHIRRGDYIKGTPFGPVEMPYINKAMNLMIEKGYKKFLIFSDDIAWCRNNIINDDIQIEFMEGNDEFVDMELMSSCEHNIIANSTFSWWGAWLNQNPNKIVIAPEKWFDGVNKDLIPKNWIQL